MKKLITMALTLAFCAFGVSMMASANTVQLSFTFTNVTDTKSAPQGTKNDMQQQYCISINSGSTVSTTNVYGGRVKRVSDNANMSIYDLHTKLKSSAYYNYSSAVNTSTTYVFNSKKDDSSTSSSNLIITGWLTY